MRPRAFIAATLCAALLFCGAVVMQQNADRHRAAVKSDLLYLPNQQLLNHFTAGLNSVIADMLWLRCVQYIGTESRGDRQFTWLNAMLDIIVQLDPYFTDAYRYGGMFLAALKADDDAGLRLLERGIVADPYAWELPYEAAMIYLLNRQDQQNAKKLAAHYLAMSVAAGDAPELVREVAAQLQSEYNLVDIERNMWAELLKSEDKLIRQTAERKLKELAIRSACAMLNERRAAFIAAKQRPPRTLAELGLKNEADDLGGRFILGEDGAVYNTTLLEGRYTKRQALIQKVLDRYQEEKGGYPEKLADLVGEGYFEALPENPWPGRAWRYDPAAGAVE